ncbi:MAG: hypothetical protein ACI90V_009863, partial [Bacillariaceae sp.]
MLIQYATSITFFKSKSRSGSLGCPAKREHHIDRVKDTKLKRSSPQPFQRSSSTDIPMNLFL